MSTVPTLNEFKNQLSGNPTLQEIPYPDGSTALVVTESTPYEAFTRNVTRMFTFSPSGLLLKETEVALIDTHPGYLARMKDEEGNWYDSAESLPYERVTEYPADAPSVPLEVTQPVLASNESVAEQAVDTNPTIEGSGVNEDSN